MSILSPEIRSRKIRRRSAETGIFPGCLPSSGCRECSQLCEKGQCEVFDPADINGYIYGHNCRGGKSMKFVSVAAAKNRLTVYLAQARKKKEPIL
jgi:hypothetical protein